MHTGIVASLAIAGLVWLLGGFMPTVFRSLGARFWATVRIVLGGVLAAGGILALVLSASSALPDLWEGTGLGFAITGAVQVAVAWRLQREAAPYVGPVPWGLHGAGGLIALSFVIMGLPLVATGSVWVGGLLLAAGACVVEDRVAVLPEWLDHLARFDRSLAEVPRERGQQLDALLQRMEEEPSTALRREHFRVLIDEEHQRHNACSSPWPLIQTTSFGHGPKPRSREPGTASARPRAAEQRHARRQPCNTLTFSLPRTG